MLKKSSLRRARRIKQLLLRLKSHKLELNVQQKAKPRLIMKVMPTKLRQKQQLSKQVTQTVNATKRPRKRKRRS